MPIRYVHLRTHSEYSLRDSTIRIPEKPEYGDPAKAKQANLVSRAVELGHRPGGAATARQSN